MPGEWERSSSSKQKKCGKPNILQLDPAESKINEANYGNMNFGDGYNWTRKLWQFLCRCHNKMFLYPKTAWVHFPQKIFPTKDLTRFEPTPIHASSKQTHPVAWVTAPIENPRKILIPLIWEVNETVAANIFSQFHVHILLQQLPVWRVCNFQIPRIVLKK